MARVGKRRVRAGIGAALTMAALSALTMAAPTPAAAGGGDWLYPDRDGDAAGDQVRLVGFTEAVTPSARDDGILAPADPQGNGPYYADLRVDPAAVERDAPQEIRAGYRPTPVTIPPEPEPAAGTSTTEQPGTRPVADAGTSPAGRAGADPAGGVASEVVAWLMAFGALLVVWCLAWRWRPREPRMVVRQGNGQGDHLASHDDPEPVHIKL